MVQLIGQRSTYLSRFTFGSNTHPVAAAAETKGFIVEVDFFWNIDVW